MPGGPHPDASQANPVRHRETSSPRARDLQVGSELTSLEAEATETRGSGTGVQGADRQNSNGEFSGEKTTFQN